MPRSPLGLTIVEAEIVILALKIADTQRIFNLDDLPCLIRMNRLISDLEHRF
jgi:hypothetical protein